MTTEPARRALQAILFPDGCASVSALQRRHRLSWAGSLDLMRALRRDGWLDGLELSPHIAERVAPKEHTNGR